MDLLVEKIKEIEMPDDMRERMIANCYKKMNSEVQVKMNDELKASSEREAHGKININCELERIAMNRRKEKRFWKRPLTIAATLVLCVCLTGFTALATSGKLQGFFKDITNWNSTVTGTVYEQATEEVSINILKAEGELKVLVTFANPEAVPYCEFEEFGIESYRIEDTSGNVIVDNNPTDMVKMNGEQLELNISLEGIPNGNYKLIIDAFIGGKKADQPLRINGLWECEFVK